MNDANRNTLITLTGALGCLLLAGARRKPRDVRLSPRTVRPDATKDPGLVAPRPSHGATGGAGDTSPGRAPEVEPTVLRLRHPPQRAPRPRSYLNRPVGTAVAPTADDRIVGPGGGGPAVPREPKPLPVLFEEPIVERVRAIDLAAPASGRSEPASKEAGADAVEAVDVEAIAAALAAPTPRLREPTPEDAGAAGPRGGRVVEREWAGVRGVQSPVIRQEHPGVDGIQSAVVARESVGVHRVAPVVVGESALADPGESPGVGRERAGADRGEPAAVAHEWAGVDRVEPVVAGERAGIGRRESPVVARERARVHRVESAVAAHEWAGVDRVASGVVAREPAGVHRLAPAVVGKPASADRAESAVVAHERPGVDRVDPVVVARGRARADRPQSPVVARERAGVDRVESAVVAREPAGAHRAPPVVVGTRAAVGPAASVGVGSVVGGGGGVGGGLVCEGLVGRGCSERLAQWLVVGARSHGLPFVGAGGLVGAVREEVVRALPRFAGLPLGGAAVAVVGAGGVGKTRVAAALAVAYGGGSSLAARAIAVGGAREGSSLVGLLAGGGVPVTVGEEFGGRERRSGEFVVVDTPGFSPADGDGIALLGERLAVLECDGVLIAMPASVGLGAARQMLAAFAPLGISGIVLTHVDETDQHGVAIELSIGTGVPVAYLHGGRDPRGALRSATPEHLARELLP